MPKSVTLFHVKFIRNGGGNPSYDGKYITRKYYDGIVRYVCDNNSPPLMMTFDDIAELHQKLYNEAGHTISSYQVEPVNFSDKRCCKCCFCWYRIWGL